MTVIFPIVYAIEYYDFKTLQTLALTSSSIKFAIKDIPFLFPPLSSSLNNFDGGNIVKILTVGDGNLSFSYSLAYFFNTHLPEINLQLTATTFDSYKELTKKYPETKQIILKLLKYQCDVKHGIDAINLSERVLQKVPLSNTNKSSCNRYSYIFFMHPHLGIEDYKLHGLFLAHFFASCLNVCVDNADNNTSSTDILLSLVVGQAERWKLEYYAKRLGWICLEKQMLNLQNFGGYEVKRTNTGKSFKNVPTQKHVYTTQESFIYRLVKQNDYNNKKKSCKMIIKNARNAGLEHAWRHKQGKVKDINLVINNNNNKQKKKSANDTLVKEEEIFCKLCNKTFSTKQGFRTHTNTVHVLKLFDKSKTFHCKICKRDFNSKEGYMQHNIAKHTSDGTKNKQSDYNKTKKTSIDSTRSSSIRETTNKECCTICNEYYSGTYEDHLSMFRPSTFLHKYNCNHCKKRTFRNLRALEQHENFCKLKMRKKPSYTK